LKARDCASIMVNYYQGNKEGKERAEKSGKLTRKYVSTEEKEEEEEQEKGVVERKEKSKKSKDSSSAEASFKEESNDVIKDGSNYSHKTSPTLELEYNKNRSSKIEWPNKNTTNHDFLFTLDSHVAVTPLNYYYGFQPLVTAAANVAVTNIIQDPNLNPNPNTHNDSNTQLEHSALEYWKDSKEEMEKDEEKDSKESREDTIIGNDGVGNVDPHNELEVECNSIDSDIANSNSVLKMSCNIGDTLKKGAYVSHTVVRSEGCQSSMMQMQTKACAGLEPPPSMPKPLMHSSDDSMEVELGARSNKNKADEAFHGNFLYDYHDSNSKEDKMTYHKMKISINEGPALNLIDKCLDMAASNSALMSGARLKALPQGPARRGMVDDITVVVLMFK
jgi:hypothetical protein